MRLGRCCVVMLIQVGCCGLNFSVNFPVTVVVVVVVAEPVTSDCTSCCCCCLRSIYLFMLLSLLVSVHSPEDDSVVEDRLPVVVVAKFPLTLILPVIPLEVLPINPLSTLLLIFSVFYSTPNSPKTTVLVLVTLLLPPDKKHSFPFQHETHTTTTTTTTNNSKPELNHSSTDDQRIHGPQPWHIRRAPRHETLFVLFILNLTRTRSMPQ